MEIPKRFTNYPTAEDIARARQRDYHRDYARAQRKAHVRLVLNDIKWGILAVAIAVVLGMFLVWRISK